MSYTDVQKIYTELFNHPVISVFTKIAVGFAILFILVQLVRKYLKSAGDPNNKMKPYDFIRPAIIVAVLLGFNTILNTTDKIGSAVDTELNKYFEDPKTYDQVEQLKKLEQEYQDPNLQESGITGVIAKIGAFFDKIESYIILFLWDILGALGDIINSITYTVALVIRFAMMFFLRCFGPIALVFAIIDKYENSFWNWLRQYSFYYLWLYAIFVINLFFNLFYQYSKAVFVNSQTASDEGWATGSLILAAIIAKITLYKRSHTLLGEIITGK